MFILFYGLLASLVYGLLGAALVWYLNDKPEAQLFFEHYTKSFKTLFLLGLAIGVGIIAYRTQNIVPETVEKAFTEEQLSETDYFDHKANFENLFYTIKFMALLSVAGFVIFKYCRFPLSQPGETLMLIAVWIQYAIGAYVGRKLLHIGMMLHSLLDVKITRNLFEKRELDNINTYVNAASTVTIICTYVHVASYYAGPFLYDSMFKDGVKIFIALPAILATPVLLIFNFYPRYVLRKLYSQSIDIEIKKLQKVMQNETLSAYEKRAHIIEFNKMAQDELRYSLQLSLTDLPIGITILIMVLEPILRR